MDAIHGSQAWTSQQHYGVNPMLLTCHHACRRVMYKYNFLIARHNQ
ncbi:hypothetical protein [Paenibacillus hunanensis]|nr:hypothetical protein [Paenibacillus hunanensis]